MNILLEKIRLKPIEAITRSVLFFFQIPKYFAILFVISESWLYSRDERWFLMILLS